MLAQRGHRVDVYEKRPDPTLTEVDPAESRSINLTISLRSIRAFENISKGPYNAELCETLLAHGSKYYGRYVHSRDYSVNVMDGSSDPKTPHTK